MKRAHNPRMDPDSIDLCDLDRFAAGFPHETFRWYERPSWSYTSVILLIFSLRLPVW